MAQVPSRTTANTAAEHVSDHEAFRTLHNLWEAAALAATTGQAVRKAAGAGWEVYTPSAGGGYATVQEEGTGLTQRATLNFVGMATAADDSANSRTNVTITDPVPAHVAAADPHTGYRLESVAITAADVAADVATQAELDTVIQTVGTRTRVTTTTFTFAGTDAGTFKDFDNAAAVTVTVPDAASVSGSPMTVGTATVTLCQMGAGQVTVVGATGVTIVSRGSAFKLAGQHAVATLIRRSADLWVLSGDIVV